jgi:prevent-host-death family protein
MLTMTVSQARASLPEVLARVNDGEEVTITRHGRPIAVLVRPDALRSRRAEAVLAEAEKVHDMLEEARRSPRPGRPGLTPERADELVRSVRADRRR